MKTNYWKWFFNIKYNWFNYLLIFLFIVTLFTKIYFFTFILALMIIISLLGSYNYWINNKDKW